MSEKITLRDKMAIAAMQAIISKIPSLVTDVGVNQINRMVARGAYDYADAMLAERYEED